MSSHAPGLEAPKKRWWEDLYRREKPNPFDRLPPGWSQWPRAVQQLFEFISKFRRFGPMRITLRELAIELECSISNVEKAIRWALRAGIIGRWFQYGPRDICGKMIEIIVSFLPPKPGTPIPDAVPDAAGATSKGRRKGKGGPIPNVPPIPKTTPEQIAAAAAANDAINAPASEDEDDEPVPPRLAGETHGAWFKRLAAALAGQPAASEPDTGWKPPVRPPVNRGYDPASPKIAKIEAELAAKRTAPKRE